MLEQQIKLQGIRNIQLWRMSTTMRAVLTAGKFQLYLMALAGTVVFPILMYEKYM